MYRSHRPHLTQPSLAQPSHTQLSIYRYRYIRTTIISYPGKDRKRPKFTSEEMPTRNIRQHRTSPTQRNNPSPVGPRRPSSPYGPLPTFQRQRRNAQPHGMEGTAVRRKRTVQLKTGLSLGSFR